MKVTAEIDSGMLKIQCPDEMTGREALLFAGGLVNMVLSKVRMAPDERERLAKILDSLNAVCGVEMVEEPLVRVPQPAPPKAPWYRRILGGR